MKTTLSIFSVSLLAFAAPAMAAPFDGPYVGLQGGYEIFNVDTDLVGTGGLAGESFTTELSMSGINGGLFAGFGKRFDNRYLGLELDASIGNADHKTAVASGGSTASIEFDHKRTYGASLRAGFLPAETTLLYGRVGVVRSTFDATVTVSDGVDTFTGSDDKSLNGLRFGLGAETALSPKLTARLDWAYTAYQDYSTAGADGSAKLDPDSSTFRLGLAYNF